MTPIRTRYDLVRTKDYRHAMVAEIDRRMNTCTLQFGSSGPFKSDVSWWDLLQPTEETYEYITGASSRNYWRPDTHYARQMPASPVLVS